MFLSSIYHFSAFFHRNSLILKYSKGWKIHLLSSSLCFYLSAGEGLFERYGWQVETLYLGNPMRHDEKYLLINQGFAGKQRLMPFFNRSNNPNLILAIQSAGVSRGRNGFRKDKSGEKLAESEEDLLEHRTDGSDAFDTLYIGCEKFPVHDIVNVPVSGVI